MGDGSAEFGRLAELLRKREEDLIGRWADAVGASLGSRATRAEIEVQLCELYEHFLRLLGAGAGPARTAEQADVRRALADLSRVRARQGLTPTETAVGVFALKGAILSLLEHEDDSAELYREFIGASLVIDELGLVSFETYVEAREEVIHAQAEQLLELSTPVVKLWEGVVCVPLVGTLDSARTQVVMETLLQTLVETGSEHAIIDITGVAAVDTQVAQHLLKTIMAARLMGAECIISGIRPQIAQTVVALGIDFGDITTKSSLADALVTTLRKLGVDIIRRRSA